MTPAAIVRLRLAFALALSMTSLLGACGAAAHTSFGTIPTAAPTPVDACSRTAPQDLCLLILGDSIAAGWPLTGPDRWWVRLHEALATELADRAVVVENLAIPGSGIATLEAAAAQREPVATYDVVVIIEGVNDNEVMPLEAWRSRYAAVVAALEAAGTTVVIGTPPPSFEDGGFRARYAPIAAALREIAGGRRDILDLDAAFRSDGAARAASYYSDVLHQTAAGQARMAELARAAIAEAWRPSGG